jgi:hypothetical protein
MLVKLGRRYRWPGLQEMKTLTAFCLASFAMALCLAYMIGYLICGLIDPVVNQPAIVCVFGHTEY